MKKLPDLLWDLWCLCSVVGIWPRFIEPKLVTTTRLTLPIKNLPSSFNGFKIIQFSDLHINSKTSDAFLKRLSKKINAASPDLLLFTGDFVCYSSDSHLERLGQFLNSLKAPYGCYAIYGNHDYSEFVSVNALGHYDVIKKSPSAVVKGFKRLFTSKTLQRKISPKLAEIPTNPRLDALLKQTPFKLLHNECVQIERNGASINLCGVGEYMMGKCLPEKTFHGYNKNVPGIVMAHNPDCISLLSSFPGDVVLCGHTHGGQINIPGIRRKFIMIENQQFSKGLHKAAEKWIYTNRGLGGVMEFRWGCPPEILNLTLEQTV